MLSLRKVIVNVYDRLLKFLIIHLHHFTKKQMFSVGHGFTFANWLLCLCHGSGAGPGFAGLGNELQPPCPGHPQWPPIWPNARFAT